MTEPQPSKEVTNAEESKVPQPAGRAVQLPVWQRILAALLGTAGGFAGIWAIIVSGKDGAGSVALIVGSIIFWFVALVGVIPYKLWGKDMGYEMGITQDAAERIMDAVPESARQGVVYAVTESPRSRTDIMAETPLTGEIGASMASAMVRLESLSHATRRVVDDVINELKEQHPERSIRLRPVEPGELGDDVVITDRGNLYIDYRLQVDQSLLARQAGRSLGFGDKLPKVRLLIITPGSMTVRAERYLRRIDPTNSRLSVLSGVGPDGWVEIRDEIRRLLGIMWQEGE